MSLNPIVNAVNVIGNIIDTKLVMYGPIPFEIPTKILEAYGNNVLKQKTGSGASVYSGIDETTTIQLVGFFRGPNRRTWKNALKSIAKIQAASLHISKILSLKFGFVGQILKFVFDRVVRFAMAFFPFVSEMCFETNMYVKSLIFEDDSELQDTYSFIITLEKKPPETVFDYIVDIGNGVVNFVKSIQLAVEENRTGRTHLTNFPAVSADPVAPVEETNISEEDSSSFDEFGADREDRGFTTWGGFDSSRTWYSLPLETNYPQDFTITAGSDNYRIRIRKYSSPEDYMKMTVDTSDQAIAFDDRIQTGMTYKIVGPNNTIYIGFKTIDLTVSTPIVEGVVSWD